MPTPFADPRMQVGAPDPERETSPIVGEGEELEFELEPNLPGGGCRFNGVAYRVGDSVISGDERLRCEAPGVWVRVGELRARRL